MTNFLSNPFENSTVSPVELINSQDGAYRFANENLSSFNFDGIVPTVLDDIYLAKNLKPGMYFIIPGTDDTLRSIVEVNVNEDDEDGEMDVIYVGPDNILSTYTCNGDDELTVQYESWDEKVLGTQGWTITSGGNAIFTNVAVRGEIEAQTLDVGGSTGITYDGSQVVIGASVVVNAPIEFNGVTPEELSASLGGYIPDGQAAADIITNSTTITGGNISTGRIRSSGYDGPVSGGGSFSTVGSQFNLDDGTIVTPNFRIDSSGDANFRGTVTGSQFSTSQTLDGTDALPSRISILNSQSGFIGPVIKFQNFNSFAGNPSRVVAGLKYITGSTLSSDFVFQGTFLSNYRFSGGGIYADFFSGVGGGLTNLDGTNISTGTVAAARIADLDASKITTGTFSTARLSGTYGISITGNAATATTATYANNLDSSQSGGAKINGNSVLVVNVGTSTSSDLIRRNASNELKATSSSSKKIKTNISLLENVNILDIDVVQFKYIDGYLDEKDQRFNKLMPGFIAEQVYETLPEAVDLDENGEPKNWNDRILIPIIVKTIQDQQKIIEDLQDRVLQLESQIGG